MKYSFGYFYTHNPNVNHATEHFLNYLLTANAKHFNNKYHSGLTLNGCSPKYIKYYNENCVFVQKNHFKITKDLVNNGKLMYTTTFNKNIMKLYEKYKQGESMLLVIVDKHDSHVWGHFMIEDYSAVSYTHLTLPPICRV